MASVQRESIGAAPNAAERADLERDHAIIRGGLDDNTVRSLIEQAKMMNLDDAIALALE